MRSIVQLLQISETAQEESIHSRGSENKQPALAQPCRVCQTSPCISCFCHNNLSVRRHRGAACGPGLKRLQRPTSLERLLRSPDPSHGVSGAVPVATQKVPDANLGGRTGYQRPAASLINSPDAASLHARPGRMRAGLGACWEL